MFEIVESTYSDPVRMIAKPGVVFIPGQIVMTRETEDGNTVCDLADGSMRALGLAGNECYVKKLSFLMADMVEVWSQRMIFRCDQYEVGTKFGPGSPLYVGKNGLFTSKPQSEDFPWVARVTMVPNNKHEYFEAQWL